MCPRCPRAGTTGRHRAVGNLFLVRWLATAQKQRRFSRDVAPDIEWLLKQARQHGVRAELPKKLDYLWRSCHGKLSDQSDLFRLTYAFELVKDAGWMYDLLADREWTGRHALKLNPAVNGIYALRSSIDNGFDEDGRTRYPLQVRITGNVAAIRELFETCGWNVRGISETTDKNNYLLTAKTMRLED